MVGNDSRERESNFVGFKGFIELDCEHKADVVLSLDNKNVTLNYSVLNLIRHIVQKECFSCWFRDGSCHSWG